MLLVLCPNIVVQKIPQWLNLHEETGFNSGHVLIQSIARPTLSAESLSRRSSQSPGAPEYRRRRLRRRRVKC